MKKKNIDGDLDNTFCRIFKILILFSFDAIISCIIVIRHNDTSLNYLINSAAYINLLS